MIKHWWHSNYRVLEICPLDKLHIADIRALTSQVDPVIIEHACLRGLLINAKDRPGCASFVALLPHCVFARGQQKHIYRIGVLSDHGVLGFMPQLVDHFISAEVRPCPQAQFQSALDWLGEVG